MQRPPPPRSPLVCTEPAEPGDWAARGLPAQIVTPREPVPTDLSRFSKNVSDLGCSHHVLNVILIGAD